MQNLLTDGPDSTNEQNEIVPMNVTVEPGNTGTPAVIDLDEDEVIVHDISTVGGAWEAAHANETPRPAPKGRPDYKTQKQRLRELEDAYLKAKAELDEEWEIYEKKMKALKKKRKKALKRNNKLIAVEYTQADFVGDYPDIVEEKLMNVGFTGISFEPIKDVLAHNTELLDVVENVVVNSIINFQPKDLFPYDCPIVINYHEKARLEFPFSASELKKMNIEEVEKALTDAGFSNITKTEVKLSGLNFLKKPGRIDSFKVHGFGLTIEHQTAEFDELIEITYYIK